MKYNIDIPPGHKAKVELIDQTSMRPFLHITIEPIEEFPKVNLIDRPEGLLSKIRRHGKKG